MKKILLLTSYKGFFGSKQITKIYNGGMDIQKIKDLFLEYGYDFNEIEITKINLKEILKERPIIIYTSSEDKHNLYKSYIEDIIFHLEEAGLWVLPSFKYLKAHNNKVAMELLRDRSFFTPIKTIQSRTYGTYEEIKKTSKNLFYPLVLKSASGAMSSGVYKAETKQELLKHAKKISSSKHFWHDLKEILRTIKYFKKYKRESFFRNKFILQNLIPGLVNDWKVLVYDNKCFVLFRGVKKGDFRASGSGNFIFKKNLPKGLLDFAYSIRNHFNVPHISLDIGFDGNCYHLIEFQFLYFGTTTLEKAPFYYRKVNENWEIIEAKSSLEDVYVASLVSYINKNKAF